MLWIVPEKLAHRVSVQKPSKIGAVKGMKQVEVNISQESGMRDIGDIRCSVNTITI